MHLKFLTRSILIAVGGGGGVHIASRGKGGFSILQKVTAVVGNIPFHKGE